MARLAAIVHAKDRKRCYKLITLNQQVMTAVVKGTHLSKEQTQCSP